MPRLLDYMDVKNRIEEDGSCKLISTVYINSKENLIILCSCGEPFNKTFDAFRSGQRKCNDCSEVSRIKKRSLSIQNVSEFVSNNSECGLISTEYINSHTALEFKCKCGEHFFTEFDKFKSQNKRKCNKCSGVYVPSYDEVKNEIENHGCILLSTNYINNRSKLSITCPCGNNFLSSYEHFKGKEIKCCQECAYKRAQEKMRTDISEVKQFIIDNGCIPLFATYENNRQKLDMLCKCGTFFRRQFHDFKNRNKRCCFKCSKSMSKGELEIQRILLSDNVPFSYQYKFDDCRGKKLPLPFDFAFFSDKSKSNLLGLIEFQGHQHYKVTDFGGRSREKAEKEFIQRQKNDKIKYDYCIKNNIELVIIPYWEIENIVKILTDKGLLQTI